MKKIFYFLFLIGAVASAQQSKTTISGTISSEGKPVAFATVYVKSGNQGVDANENGEYSLTVPEGNITLIVQYQGYRTQNKKVLVKSGINQTIDFNIVEDALGLDQVVVSATRNRISKKEAPVIVNIISPKLFRATQSISLADALNYQPGVRLETNCQNCGFSQVRLNGLEGQYTQVLVNSRPIFSALNGVYGLEQIPVSIIDRVEVVRSGGSALFGSNAIAGTVNVITKEPVNNSWDVSSSLSLIDGQTPDRSVNMNASIVNEELTSGVTVYGMYRNRESYDANDDGFSEITELTNNSLGAKAFLKPNDNSKIGLDFTAIKEFRRGGNKLDLAPQFTDITEQLDHNTVFTGLDYELLNDARTNSLTAYVSAQHTDRGSYYGGLGGGTTHADSISAANAFGTTKDLALVSGAKFTHNFKNNDVLTTGIEYQLNDTEDIISGYNRLVDQKVNNYGLYAQYEWKPTESFSALMGGRLDHADVDGNYTLLDIERSSKVNETVLSPRLTILYNINEVLQFRGGYSRGFRAPQAFNEDLHVASVSGEQSFVILSDNLESEFSNAYTASFNFTKDFNKTQTNFTVEGFYTTIENPFTIVSTGTTLSNGSLLKESQNGEGAHVAGTNLELSVSPSPKLFFQAGLTLQKSTYKEDQLLFDSDNDDEKVYSDKLTRSPNAYGFFNTNWEIIEDLRLDVTGTYTGSMFLVHTLEDGSINLVDSNEFLDMTTKLTYHFDPIEDFHVEVSGGVQNIFNSYQNDFDTGALRDSTYIYGPNQPRTVFIGLKFGDF